MVERKKVTVKGIKFLSVTTDTAKAYQIVTIGKLRFKLYANTSRSSPIGFNGDLCVKLIKEDGTLVNIVDSYSLALPKDGNYARNPIERREKVTEVFKGFVAHLEEMYL